MDERSGSLKRHDKRFRPRPPIDLHLTLVNIISPYLGHEEHIAVAPLVVETADISVIHRDDVYAAGPAGTSLKVDRVGKMTSSQGKSRALFRSTL